MELIDREVIEDDGRQLQPVLKIFGKDVFVITGQPGFGCSASVHFERQPKNDAMKPGKRFYSWYLYIKSNRLGQIEDYYLSNRHSNLPCNLDSSARFFRDLSLEEVLAFAGSEGYQCVRSHGLPSAKEDRPYGGTCHIDVKGVTQLRRTTFAHYATNTKVQISALGYYANALSDDVRTKQRSPAITFAR